MHKKFNKIKNDRVFKTVKLDTETHKLLRIYVVENDFTLREAVRNLLNKIAKKG